MPSNQNLNVAMSHQHLDKFAQDQHCTCHPFINFHYDHAGHLLVCWGAKNKDLPTPRLLQPRSETLEKVAKINLVPVMIAVLLNTFIWIFCKLQLSHEITILSPVIIIIGLRTDRQGNLIYQLTYILPVLADTDISLCIYYLRPSATFTAELVSLILFHESFVSDCKAKSSATMAQSAQPAAT